MNLCLTLGPAWSAVPFVPVHHPQCVTCGTVFAGGLWTSAGGILHLRVLSRVEQHCQPRSHPPATAWWPWLSEGRKFNFSRLMVLEQYF